MAMAESHVHFHVLNIKNLTTQLDLISPAQQTPIEALDCQTDQITFSCRQQALQTGQLVTLSGRIKSYEFEEDFACVGKVTSTEDLGGRHAKVCVHLTQFDREKWDKLLSGLEVQQAGVDRIFFAMRDEI